MRRDHLDLDFVLARGLLSGSLPLWQPASRLDGSLPWPTGSPLALVAFLDVASPVGTCITRATLEGQSPVACMYGCNSQGYVTLSPVRPWRGRARSHARNSQGYVKRRTDRIHEGRATGSFSARRESCRNRESGASVFLKNTFRFLASSSQRAVYRISRGPSPDAPRSSVASRLSGCVLRYLSRHTHSTTAVGRGPARIRRSRSCTSLPSSDWDLLPALYSCFGIRMVVHEAGRPRPGRKEQKRIGRWRLGDHVGMHVGDLGSDGAGCLCSSRQSLRPPTFAIKLSI